MKKKKHPLDFPGSQAAMYADALVEVVSENRTPGNTWHWVRWPQGEEYSLAWLDSEYMHPIGPVARELLRARE